VSHRPTPGMDRAIAIVTVALILCVFIAIAACRSGAPGPNQERRDNGAYYRSCDDAPGPLRAGDPGYRRALDSDRDGVACDG